MNEAAPFQRRDPELSTVVSRESWLGLRKRARVTHLSSLLLRGMQCSARCPDFPTAGLQASETTPSLPVAFYQDTVNTARKMEVGAARGAPGSSQVMKMSGDYVKAMSTRCILPRECHIKRKATSAHTAARAWVQELKWSRLWRLQSREPAGFVAVIHSTASRASDALSWNVRGSALLESFLQFAFLKAPLCL